MKKVRNKKQIVEATYEWCCSKFGTPLKTNQFPTLGVVSKSKCDDYGIYDSRHIEINTAKCKTVSSLIRVVIHEYTHFLQMPKIYDMGKYQKLYEIYGYYEHPMEIEAREAELKHFRNCLKYLQRRNIA
jgi:hypothetical protein